MIMGCNSNEGAGFGTFNASGLSPLQYQIGLAAIVCPVVKEVQYVKAAVRLDGLD